MKIACMDIGFIKIPVLTTLNTYVVGYSLRCLGCNNPKLRDFKHPEAYKINIQDLCDKINKNHQLNMLPL